MEGMVSGRGEDQSTLIYYMNLYIYEYMNMRIAWSLFAPVRFSFKPFTTAKAAIAFEN